MAKYTSKKRITIKEVAQQTKLSVATVGRVFASPEQVKPDTLERVMKVAEQLGYQPILAGKALRTGKSYEIAIMLPFDRVGAASTMGAAQYNLIAGFSSGLHNSGYNIKLLPYTSKQQMHEVFNNYLAKSRPDAFVITQLEPQDERLRQLTDRQIPIVSFGQSDLNLNTHSFDFDNFAFTFDAVERLVKQGRKRITYLSTTDNYMHYLNQLAGFEEATRVFNCDGIEFDTVKLDLADNTQLEQALSKIASTSDAVITVSAHLTHQLKKAITLQDKKVGDDTIICTSTATLNILQMLDIPILCYYQDFSLAGEKLSELAIDIANNNASAAKNIINLYEVIHLK